MAHDHALRRKGGRLRKEKNSPFERSCQSLRARWQMGQRIAQLLGTQVI
jgi:hypothetical protein